jgi:hypothetical protein
MSHGHDVIKACLDALNIKYVEEYPVRIDGRLRRFDFLLRLNGKDAFVEFDGAQHFRGGWGRTAEDINQVDFEKNTFARERGVSLLRVSYKRLDCVGKMLVDFIRAVLTSDSVITPNPSYFQRH